MKQLFFAILILLQSALFGQNTANRVARNDSLQNLSASFSGTILLAKKGVPLLVKSYGKQGIDAVEDLQNNAVYRIASITKTFITVLTLQLVDEGKIDLDVPFGRYIPWFEGEVAQQATIAHLLSFSAGIPNCEGDSGMKVYQAELTPRAFIERHVSGKAMFKPGTAFNYENGSFILLGELLKEVTGKSVETLLQERIFGPCGMKQSGIEVFQSKNKPYVDAFLVNDSTKTPYPESKYFLSNYSTSGAMWSTVEDLLKFDRALFGGKLLSNNSMTRLLTPNPDLYGVSLGWWVYKGNIGGKDETIVNRQGSIQGSNTLWMHLLNSDITLILFSNSNAKNLQQYAYELLNDFLQQQ